jgi:predicted nucleotidyltransferase
MNSRETAVWEIHQFLNQINIPYAIIGGMAVQHWGEPRFTQDVDLTVSAPINEPEIFLKQLLEQFPPRLDEALAFALRNRVLLVQASNGCPIDISLALPGYEDEVMERAVAYEIAPGKIVRLCSAEDLIIHKAVAGRPQDSRDIEGIVYRQRRKLDAAHIRRWLQSFADLLDKPEVLQVFETPWRKIA